LGEIIRRSFGEAINYDDLTDPDVRRLVFLSHSASGMHQVQLVDARELQWNRQQVRSWLATLDRIDSSQENIPGTLSYIHREWVRSLPYFNPLTYEFQLPETETSTIAPQSPEPPPAEIIQLGRAVHAEARNLLDSSQDRQGKVLSFPSAREQEV
jgi:hypothetical protein